MDKEEIDFNGISLEVWVLDNIEDDEVFFVDREEYVRYVCAAFGLSLKDFGYELG